MSENDTPDTAEVRLHWSNDDISVHKIVVGPYDNNVFFVESRADGQAIMLDAANDAEVLLELAERFGVTTIIQTHGHWDHIQAVDAMRAAGYEIGVTEADAPMLSAYDYVIHDGDVITAGAVQLRAITTPGHTKGSVCFDLLGTPLLFTGDTLFPGGPGATKGEGASFPSIIDSIQDRLFDFDDDTIILPGHGDDSTIGAERPHLQEWIDRGW